MASLKPILSLLLAAPVAAQALGTWKVAASPDLPLIIEQATAPMNFVTRPIARARLKKTNSVYHQIQISRTATEFLIQYDDRAAQHMPVSGQAVPWVREDGDKFQISAQPQGDDLVQTYQAEDGKRVNRFHVDASGTLTMAVTVTSPRLPNPVSYSIPYRR